MATHRNEDHLFYERALIGGLLCDRGTVHDCADLGADDFTSPVARELFATIRALSKGAQGLSLPGVVNRHSGHASWIAEAMDQVGLVSVAGAASIIRAGAKRRRLLTNLKGIFKRIEQGTEYPVELAVEDIGQVYRQHLDGVVDQSGDLGEVLSSIKARHAQGEDGCLETGYSAMRDRHATLQPGHLWVIGGRTSVGKTAFMLDLVAQMYAEAGQAPRTALFSTEMTSQQLFARMVAHRTGVNASVYLGGGLHANLHGKVDAAEKSLQSLPLKIFDRTFDVDRLVSEARRLSVAGGVDLVIIDFLQNLRKRGKFSSRREQFVEIALDVQALAKELNCCVVAMSQIPAAAAKQDAGILEFKESGEIANACDVGILLYRAKEDNRVVIVDVRKNRHGATFTFPIRFNESWTAFTELQA